jgi:hypothetical protein
VDVRPGILVVRDLHRQRTTANALVGTFHLGSTATPQTLGGGQYKVGTINVSSFSSTALGITFTMDVDQSNTSTGEAMHFAIPATTTPVEVVTVISDTATGVSYTGGVLKLSSNQCVTFANGDVSVASCH